MQYTIRGIPPAVDSALRERARQTGKSLNEAALEALAEGAGVTGSPRKRRDLSDMLRAGFAKGSTLHARDRHFDELPQIVRA